MFIKSHNVPDLGEFANRFDILAVHDKSERRSDTLKQHQTTRRNRAKIVLRENHETIFAAFGETLATVDINDPDHMREAEQRQEKARAAWKLARGHAEDVFGKKAVRDALRELGLSG